jgi:hypothetical protein
MPCAAHLSVHCIIVEVMWLLYTKTSSRHLCQPRIAQQDQLPNLHVFANVFCRDWEWKGPWMLLAYLHLLWKPFYFENNCPLESFIPYSYNIFSCFMAGYCILINGPVTRLQWKITGNKPIFRLEHFVFFYTQIDAFPILEINSMSIKCFNTLDLNANIV